MWTDRGVCSIISSQSHKELTQDLLRNLGRENLKELRQIRDYRETRQIYILIKNKNKIQKST